MWSDRGRGNKLGRVFKEPVNGQYPASSAAAAGVEIHEVPRDGTGYEGITFRKQLGGGTPVAGTVGHILGFEIENSAGEKAQKFFIIDGDTTSWGTVSFRFPAGFDASSIKGWALWLVEPSPLNDGPCHPRIANIQLTNF
jgi:hypothetical protein